jgi:urea transport system ATP-binding protein
VVTGYLALRGVSVSFSGFLAVNQLDLAVEKGELRCLIGPNGAGKTTALDLICGKTKPQSGTITLAGVPLHTLEDYQIARAGVGRKFQVPSLFRELTVRENFEVAYARETGIFRTLRRSARGAEANGLEMLADLVGLREELAKPAAYLSHGQTQWLEIGMLLAQDAALILMDEPTAGMTAQETRKTADLFLRLKGKHTLIVVEHDMGFVKAIGDVISVMHQGRLLAEGSVREIETHPEVKKAYLGSGGISNA